MRDPSGNVRLEHRHAVRTLNPGSQRDETLQFLAGPVARQLVADGLLLPFEIVSQQTVLSPRISPVSYPFEWCSAQLHDAASLTLDISERLLASAHELKDASAWNVVFEGSRPLFCDHASMQAIRSPQWWAFGQFVRHFVFPLQLARYGHTPAHEVFLAHRDGIDGDIAARRLPMRARASSLAPLLFASRLAAWHAAPRASTSVGQSRHKGVYSYARMCLPHRGAQPRRSGHWRRYRDQRAHYSDSALSAKRERVMAWLQRSAAKQVVDLGCNTGEFALLAASAGASVTAIDGDHDCIQSLYLACEGRRDITPLIADLSDLPAGRGWSGDEFPGLVRRLRAGSDMVLMLAIAHHLRLSCSVPFDEIARLAADISTRYVIYEIVGPLDPMVQQLAVQHAISSEAMSPDLQLHALARHFRVIERAQLPLSKRELLLLERLP